MRARLAIALSLAIEFDCYLIDEVIMVGDANFHHKFHYELFEKRRGPGVGPSITQPRPHPRVLQPKTLVLHNGFGTMYSEVDEALDVYSAL